MKHRKNRISLKAARAWALLLVFLVSLAGTACSSNPDATGNNNPNEEEITMPKDAPLLSSDELIGMFAADSMVLLKNENNCLPLAKGTKLNLFGYNATDKGYLLSGGGSGTGVWASDANIVGFAQAFREAGIDINEELLRQYAAWDTLDMDSNVGFQTDPNSGESTGGPQGTLSNPGADFYTDALLQQAKDFSDTAVVVLSRYGRENQYVRGAGNEIPLVQIKSKLPADETRTYLQISTEEELMLEKVTANFDKVIVLLNLCNTMELGFLNDGGIDAAMFIGTTGQSGTRAIPQLLFGDVTPSGKTADVYAYNHKADPTWANFRPDHSNANNKFVSYTEGIYYGYRWYETAFADGVKLCANGYDLDFSSEEGYRKIVQYPFGYGLSYTSFSWELTQKPGDVIEKGGSYTVRVKVTNTGSASGKEVVQLYMTPPYTAGGIEKAAVTLIDFAKTDTLQPGESQELTLSFTDYQLASYDCYDLNGNSHAGYELEKGAYELKLMRNAHELSEAGVITMQVKEDIKITEDPTTGQTVENRYTGTDAYSSPIDGGLTYMTRADFTGTFPSEKVCGVSTGKPKNVYAEPKTVEYDNDSGLYLFTNSDGSKAKLSDLGHTTYRNLVFNEELARQLADYDNEEIWNKFLSQISKQETMDVIKDAGFKIHAIESLGMPETLESDGPSGLSRATGSSKISWPAESLIACSWNTDLAYEMGRAVGKQGQDVNINGWYAPGLNLHRSPYTSRNFEYYSEDPILSGKLAAQVVRGARNFGLTCYIKHFAVSEGGKNPLQVNTWLTEQAMRELYLKPFELAVKDGGANGVMSAFNRIGDVFCGHNQALLQGVLRTEWGFRGCVITDWWSESMTIEACVLAGNDKMLTPKDRLSNPQYMPLNASNSVNANAARTTIKNILYPFIANYVNALDYAKAQTN